MKKVNTKFFYISSQNQNKEGNDLIVPSSVFRQELVTWEHTDSGIKRTTVVRSFDGNGHIDSYKSEPIALNRTS